MCALTRQDADAIRRTKRVANIFAATLRDLGTSIVFVLPGGAIAPLLDALVDFPEIRTVNTRTEAGAMFAAAAYARYSGKAGVVIVTSGPGVLNALTGLAAAQRDGLPVVLIAGDIAQANNGRNAVQDGSAQGLDIVSVARPLCMRAFGIARPDAAEPTLRLAFQTALGVRRGSVFINLPMDVSAASTSGTGFTSNWASVPNELSAVSESAIVVATEQLAAARRPLILAGSGARAGNGPEMVRRVAEHFCMPVVTTPKGKGVFPEGHGLSLGVFGHGGHPSAAAYVDQGPDAILVLGSALGDAATNGWDPKLAAASFIHVDVDATQFGRNYRPTVALHGSVADVGARLIASSRPVLRTKNDYGVSFFADGAAQSAPEGLLAPQRAIVELQRALGDDAIFTSDIGEHLMFATHYLRIERPDAYMAMTGLASMGAGIAAAAGIKLAEPKRTVAAICGDGCFIMSIGDMVTVATEKINILIAVLNDERYGMVELGMKALHGRTPLYPLGPVDIATLARGCGVEAIVVRNPGEIATLDLSRRLAAGPVVLDIRIDPSVTMPKSKRFENLSKAQK